MSTVRTDRVETSSGAQISVEPVFGSAPNYAARAWVHCNGDTATVNAAGNVSTVADLGTSTNGGTRINFTTAMPDANYAAVGGGGMDSGNSNAAASSFTDYTTTSVRHVAEDVDAGFTNYSDISVVIFR